MIFLHLQEIQDDIAVKFANGYHKWTSTPKKGWGHEAVTYFERMKEMEELDRAQYDSNHDGNEEYVDQYYIKFPEGKVCGKKVFDITPNEIIEI